MDDNRKTEYFYDVQEIMVLYGDGFVEKYYRPLSDDAYIITDKSQHERVYLVARKASSFGAWVGPPVSLMIPLQSIRNISVTKIDAYGKQLELHLDHDKGMFFVRTDQG